MIIISLFYFEPTELLSEETRKRGANVNQSELEKIKHEGRTSMKRKNNKEKLM